MKIYAVTASRRNWEEFFARIPIEEQKERRYAYEAQESIAGNLPRHGVLTIEKMLENHPFGHQLMMSLDRAQQMGPPAHETKNAHLY